MMKKVCLWLAVFAVFHSVRSEGDVSPISRQSVELFELGVEMVIQNASLYSTSIENQLEKSAQLDYPADEKNKILDKLICKVDNKVWRRKLSCLAHSVIEALVLYAVYSESKRSHKAKGGRSVMPLVFRGVWALLLSLASIPGMYYDIKELHMLHKIRQALEGAKNNSVAS